MTNALGISKEGLQAALDIKRNYRERQPILVPGEDDRLLLPENLINHQIDLSSLEDPIALAMVSARDPETPMALAAMSRLCPLGKKTRLVAGVVDILGETSRHDLVQRCLKYVTEQAFEPDSISKVRRHTKQIIVETREQFTAALRDNLRSLLDGSMSPREFVREFFELTEAGNMRSDVRKKLILSLLLSGSVRPGIKFLMLENFERMPRPVRLGIVRGVLKAESNPHVDLIREELNYILIQDSGPAGSAATAATPYETPPDEAPLPGAARPRRTAPSERPMPMIKKWDPRVHARTL